MGSKSTLFARFFLDLSDLLQIIALDTLDSLRHTRSLSKLKLYGLFHLLSSQQGFSKLRNRKTKERASLLYS